MEQLIISAITEDRNAFLEELLSIIHKHACLIEASRATMMGSELASIILVSGHWNGIAKLESSLTNLTEKGLITFKRTQAFLHDNEILPYLVQLVAFNQPTVIYEIIHFFIQQNIYIDDFQTTTYAASFTGTTMLSFTLRIGIPASAILSDFREQFALLCDELNIDGTLDPERP